MPRGAQRAAPSGSRNRFAIGALAGVLCSQAVACSSGEGGDASGGGGGSPDAGSPPDAAPGDSAILVGSFQVRLVAPVPASNGT